MKVYNYQKKNSKIIDSDSFVRFSKIKFTFFIFETRIF